ncbi:hypothetical protein COR50_07420 [Chitinophaga caeni]|uniref:Auto-transporter adhesin head GIN domain-containing protein n=1 Tax=Chitinophaga caeni TaxID=2029983 RepID=A0A291QSS9_9BACT|nr:hypothetical protein [Chitinophaga caeni]ATL47028.1 hypothetical protein COR50_07420 [Chitinophaga caeni]
MHCYFNTNKVITAAVLAVFSTTLFFACTKDNKQTQQDVDDNAVIRLAAQQAVASETYDDVFDVTLALNANNQGSLGRRSSEFQDVISQKIWYCGSASVSIVPLDLETWPKTVTVDFDAGCTDSSRVRSGKMKIVLSAPLLSTNSTATVTFENYKVNNVAVQGEVLITNLSANNVFKYSTKVTEGKLTYGDTLWVKYNGIKTVEQTAGSATPLNLLDDVYAVSGNATVENSDGNGASVNITSPLVRKLNCGYVSQGTMDIVVYGNAASIDYGNGDCDNKAMMTYKNKQIEITLPN